MDAGLLEARGKNKGKRFFLSATMYRQLGQPAAFVRREGFTALQVEQMILQHVRAYEKVTRREVMELGRVD